MSHLSGGSSGTGTSAGSAKLLNDYVRTTTSISGVIHGTEHTCSNLAIRWERARLVKSIVRGSAIRDGVWTYRSSVGALNWATGETVAVKEIQLSNIPKNEIGQIMVRIRPLSLWAPIQCHGYCPIC